MKVYIPIIYNKPSDTESYVGGVYLSKRQAQTYLSKYWNMLDQSDEQNNAPPLYMKGIVLTFNLHGSGYLNKQCHKKLKHKLTNLVQKLIKEKLL